MEIQNARLTLISNSGKIDFKEKTVDFNKRGLERRKSERQRVRTSKIFFGWSERQKSLCWKHDKKSLHQKNDQKSLRRKHGQKSLHQKECRKSKMTFDVLIFFDAIGNIRTSKVLVHFLAKNTFDVLILPMASKKIRTSKIKKSNYLWQITMCTKACGVLG